MLRAYLAGWLILVAIILTACAQTERVQVGAFAESIDFGTCLGDETRCEQGFPPARGVENRFAPTQCERVEDDGWHVAWWRKLTKLRCAPVGYCDASRVSVAEDGTFWTASFGRSPVVDSDETLFGLFLAHYDQDGEILAQRVIETRKLPDSESLFSDHPISVAIAAAARGHVFVAMAWTEDEAWVGKFDASAQPAGQRVALDGWRRSMRPGLSVARDGSVFLSAGSSPLLGAEREFNALAKLDSRLRPVWLQTRVLPPHGFYELLSGGPRLTLIGDADTKPKTFTLSQVGTLDPTGNLVDLMHLSVTGRPFAVDGSGNLFALAMDVDASIATKLTPQGELLFQVEVLSVQNPKDLNAVNLLSAAVDPEGNSFYARHWDSWDGLGITSEILTLWQLDADGERCSVSNIVNALGATESLFEPHDMVELIRADNGDLYVRTQNGIARLTR